MSMCHRTVVALLILLVGAVGSPLWAIPATGSFVADKACPAYISKNKKTNPDSAVLTVGNHYPVIAVNRATAPDWLQLSIPELTPAERWVEAKCGRSESASSENHASNESSCSIAGLADSYVFAVSWQPAFCASHQDKPECRIDNPGAYQAGNFTLHGLWPNRTACGTRYGFCGSQQKISGSFCDYPVLPLNSRVRSELEVVMPSTAAGSCLQRHEWYKHGSCQQAWDVSSYFEEGIDLLQHFNDAGMGAFMRSHLGKEVAVESLQQQVDTLFGEGAHRRMKLICSSGMLSDIYINLPSDLEGRSLGELLLAGAANDDSSNCGRSFRIPAIGR